MNPNAMRGAIIVGVALLFGALILGWGADSDGTVVTTPAALEDTTPFPTAVTIAPTAVPTTAPVLSQPRDPSQVRVQVANAANIAGIAGNFTARLNAQGYTTGQAPNAADSAVSFIYYAPGYEADARQILTIFGSPSVEVLPLPSPAPAVDDLDTVNGGSNVLIVIGTDDLSRS